MNCAAVVGLRILAVVVAVVWGAFSAGAHMLFGMETRAASVLFIMLVFVWLVRPDDEQVADFIVLQARLLARGDDDGA